MTTPLDKLLRNTRRINAIAVFAALIVGASAFAAAPVLTEAAAPQNQAIPEVWPADGRITRLSDIGRGKAVIFSPDFAEPGNRDFYEKLGFVYVEEASWHAALSHILARNYWHPEDRVETVFLETHGTNGNGLKLQAGVAPGAGRSYISIGALQEKLDSAGVRLCVIGACNAGRLFRPAIYKTIDPQTRDPLFLPPTLGIINATKAYDPSRSKVVVVRRAESEIETTSDGYTSELSPAARKALGLEQFSAGRKPRELHFVVSNLLIQMLTHDASLKLTAAGHVTQKSRNDLSPAQSDALFDRFIAYLDGIAARETQNSAVRQPASNPASRR